MADDELLSELECLYRSGFVRFVRVAQAVTGERESARDAVQDGFSRAIRRRRSFRGDGPLEGWVWQIVLNEARRSRGRRRDHPVAEPLSETQAAGSASNAEDEALREAVAGLPERQRLVLFLRYYADLDYASIAEAVGVERGTVSATLNAAHARLRETLSKEITA